jgi:hypothetical protein
MTELLAEEERARLRSRIAMTLVNLGRAHLYWLPGCRRITARSPAALRVHRLPPDAVLVGFYEHGIRARSVLEDLVDLLDRLARTPQERSGDASPAQAGEGPALTTQQRSEPRTVPQTAWTWAAPRFHHFGHGPGVDRGRTAPTSARARSAGEHAAEVHDAAARIVALQRSKG